jgi:serine/threonine protein kinase
MPCAHVRMIPPQIYGISSLNRIERSLLNNIYLKFHLNFLKALQYLASKDIAHRDIKLENILLIKYSTDFVICDLGLATFINEK